MTILGVKTENWGLKCTFFLLNLRKWQYFKTETFYCWDIFELTKNGSVLKLIPSEILCIGLRMYIFKAIATQTCQYLHLVANFIYVLVHFVFADTWPSLNPTFASERACAVWINNRPLTCIEYMNSSHGWIWDVIQLCISTRNYPNRMV